MKIVRVLAGGVEHLGRQHDDGRVTLLEGDLFGPLRDTGRVVQVEKLLAPLDAPAGTPAPSPDEVFEPPPPD
jgi:hypothetical protein